ncbi:putative membrane protein [uncultured Alphaproteobacteria bacterium]|uniref:Putative membrane protein n=1 Tax=uncultured Alphaproteobacteria bacterium TaxID=91750 RepID=A0A212JB66_9PROT|nr:putative membrane protein [uncultured Alphaproteobacteria bacterium]
MAQAGGNGSEVWASAVSTADALFAWVRLQQLEFFRGFVDAIGVAAFAANLAALLGLVSAGLLYGLFHAIGPGPGKAALAAYLLSHPASPGGAMRLGLLAALAQGGCTAALVAIGASVGAGDFAAAAGLAAVGALLAATAALRLRRVLDGRETPPRVATGWLVLAIGLRPDLVGAMVLLATQRLGVGWIGGIALAAMALGTGLAIAAFCACLAMSRAAVARLGRLAGHRGRIAEASVAVAGGVAVLAIGLLLLDPRLADAVTARLAQ